jgi:hypothetical protein
MEKNCKKYKEGDNVRVIEVVHGHRFSIGEIVEIYSIEGMGSEIGYYCKGINGGEWFLHDHEFEPADISPDLCCGITDSVVSHGEKREMFEKVYVNGAYVASEWVRSLKYQIEQLGNGYAEITVFESDKDLFIHIMEQFTPQP